MARNKGDGDHDATYEARTRNSKPDKATSNGKAKGRPPLRKAASRKASNTAAFQETTEIIDFSSSSSSNAAEDEAPETPSQKSSPENGSHKRKSILQPKGSKYSKKAMQRRGSLALAPKSASNDSSIEEIEDGASPITTARNTTCLPNRTALRPTKRSSALDGYASHHTYLVRKVEKKIPVSYALPSTTPQGPGDIWTCTFEGCNKRLHAASTEEGQAEMQEHFKDHTTSAEEKIQLAMTESRPYLPVKYVVSIP